MERPQVALGDDTAHVLLGTGLEPDAIEAALQQVEGLALADDAAAGGHHHAVGVFLGDAHQRAALVAPVAGLAVQQQDLVHAGAGLALDLPVQLDERHAAPGGELGPERRLAGAAQTDQGDALLAPLAVAQAEAGGQQRMGLLELGVVQPPQQILHAGQRRARRVLQQLEDGDVQGPGGGFQRVDRHVALAAFHVGQEALGQVGIGGQLLARHAPPRPPRAHPRAQLDQGGFGFVFSDGGHGWEVFKESLRWINIAVYFL